MATVIDVEEALVTFNAGTPSSSIDCTVLPPPRRLVPKKEG